MPKPKVTFGKITAVASPYAWAQTYHAGTLAAVVALTQEQVKKDADAATLHAVGKEIINNLEAEYFTLENKNLQAIRQAIKDTYTKSPKNVTVTIIVGAIVQNILYIFLYGNGKIYIKRKETFGTLLESTHEERHMLTASGFLQNNDTIVLATDAFTKCVSSHELQKHLGTQPPPDIAEILLPKVHAKQHNDAAAIIFSFHEEATDAEKPLTEVIVANDEQKTDVTVAEKQTEDFKRTPRFNEFPFPSFPKLPLRKMLFLLLAVGIACVLIISIVLTLKTQQQSKQHALFLQVFPPAQKKYDEGQSIIGLNKKLARDDFVSAKAMLTDAQNKFPSNTSDSQQIHDLLQKVDTALASVPEQKTPELTTVDANKSFLLATEIDVNAPAFTQDSDHVYYVDNDGVKSVDTNKKTKIIIKNDKDWSDPAGLATYLGNFYVMDRKSNQILKYVSGSEGFGKSNYFPTAPDLSKAVSTTINGSVWILTSDGKIMKYTKGDQDTFNVSGLNKPFANPSKIYTSVDIDHVYVLDNGNSRIVVLDKSGSYQNLYEANVIKNAKDFDVVEKDKKIYVLSDKKVYQIDLK